MGSWKITGFLNYSDSERIELKMLTYKVMMLLALTGSCRAHEIFHLGISYLMKHSSGYAFHFNKLTKTKKER